MIEFYSDVFLLVYFVQSHDFILRLTVINYVGAVLNLDELTERNQTDRLLCDSLDLYA